MTSTKEELMSQQITYFTSPVSPYNYLGAARFCEMVQSRGLVVDMKIMDLGQVFPETGGLPLPQRAPERLAYRLQEPKRFSQFLDLPLTRSQPIFRHLPCLANFCAAARRRGTALAMQVLETVLNMTWAQEQDSGDASALSTALTTRDVIQMRLSRLRRPKQSLQAEIAADSQLAIKEGVFGAPSFKVGDELFWGQDRLDMLAWHLDQIGWLLAGIPAILVSTGRGL